MTPPTALFARVLVWMADPTPTPAPAYSGDPNLITPGVIGFLVTFAVALVTVLLLIDMTKRMRRLRYRSEVREKLMAEQLAAELDAELEALTPGNPEPGPASARAPKPSQKGTAPEADPER